MAEAIAGASRDAVVAVDTVYPAARAALSIPYAITAPE